MQALLQRASLALSANDPGTLEELAAAASRMTALPPETDLAETARFAAILGQQVRAAAVHLSLRRRLDAGARLGGYPWAR